MESESILCSEVNFALGDQSSFGGRQSFVDLLLLIQVEDRFAHTFEIIAFLLENNLFDFERPCNKQTVYGSDRARDEPVISMCFVNRRKQGRAYRGKPCFFRSCVKLLMLTGVDELSSSTAIPALPSVSRTERVFVFFLRLTKEKLSEQRTTLWSSYPDDCLSNFETRPQKIESHFPN